MHKPIKLILVLGATAALAVTPALAADLGALPTTQAPPPPVLPALSWTGFYLGGNVGGVWGHSSWCTDATTTQCDSVGVTPADIVNESPSGVVGGGQVGYRWEVSNHLVLGVEGMVDGLDIGSTKPSVSEVGRTRSTTFDNLDSVTAQLGYAWGPILLYGKGGIGWSDLTLDANFPGNLDLRTSRYQTGGTGGVGIEYSFTPNLSLGVEYDFYGFRPSDIRNLINSGGNLIPCSFCNFGQTNVQTIMARLNWRFDWPRSPGAAPD